MAIGTQGRPVALITGASRGIGEAIAWRLAQKGYDLILTCAHNIEQLESLAKQFEEQFDITAKALKVDAADGKQVKKLFDQISQIDVLVNNAGISHVGLLTETSDEDWHKVMATNLDSVFYASKYAAQKMLKVHDGRIINISSVWGTVGASMEVAYSASKGGVNAFTKALAKELAPSNIAVNAIACGVVDTDMMAVYSAEEKAALAEEIPAGTFARPKEVAQMVENLLIAPPYFTGQILTFDGGWI